MSRLLALIGKDDIEQEASLPRAQRTKALAARRQALKAIEPRTESIRTAIKALDRLADKPGEREEAMEALEALRESIRQRKRKAAELLARSL